MKKQLFCQIDNQKERLIAMSDRIFDHPEYEGEEVMAAELLTDYLKENGFAVEMGTAGLKTAFRAEYNHKEGGPVIGILCEYDALRGLGHGCGHHMQGPSCLGAAVALKNMKTEKPFRLVIYGTPAEETLGCKCDMLEAGCFKELDVAFMMHGGPNTCTDIKCLAMSNYQVSFFGKKSHAALAPEKGKSALDALLVAFQGIEFLREHVPDDVRLHYTISELPGPCNVIPALAKGDFAIRSFSKKTLEQVSERLTDIIKGASLIAGVEYDIAHEKTHYNKIPVLLLNDLLMENAKMAGAPQLAPPREKTGSTDFGNVMYEIPGACIRVAFVPEGTSSHSQEYVDAGKTEAAHSCVIYGAKAIAGAAFDLVEAEGLLQKVKEEFAESKKKNE